MAQLNQRLGFHWLFALAIVLLLTSLACDLAWIFAPLFLPSWLAGLLVVAAAIAAVLAVVATAGISARIRVCEHLLALAVCVGYISLAAWHLVVGAAEFESDGGYFVTAAVTILLTIRCAHRLAS